MRKETLLGTTFAVTLSLLGTTGFMQESLAGSPVIVVDDAVVPVAPDGQCSLIEAFENAVDQAGTHADCIPGSNQPTTIELAADSSYSLTTVHNNGGGNGPNGLPLLAGNVLVQGQGATIQRGGSTPPFRILEVAAGGVVELQDLSIQSGSLGDPGQSGSGIRSEGSLSLSHVSMSGHSGAGAGGAIYSAGDLEIAHSTFQGNGGGGPGGAVLNAFGGTASIEYSTLAGNSCGGGGCGLQNEGTAELTNSTVSGNGGPNAAGIQNIGTLTLTHVTLAQNGGASGGDLTNNGSATLRNTLLAIPNSGSACAGAPPTFDGANIIQDDTCGCSSAAGCTVSDPGLGSLQDNGGATSTHAVDSGSSAVDAADGAHCPADDQRGFARPQGSACDIGAFERQPPPEPTTIPVDDAVVQIAPDGQCSIVEAFENAADEQQTHADCEPGSEIHTTIVLAENSTYSLVSASDNSDGPTALPLLDNIATVFGQGAIIERSSSAPPMRLLHVGAGGEVVVQNLALQGGVLGTPSDAGSGVLNKGSLTLLEVTLSGHGGPGSGGAISNSGELLIAGSLLTQNSIGGAGAAIHNLSGATLDITHSTLSGNSCGGGGCGLQNEGTANVSNSTVSGNGGPFAGGIHNIGVLTLTHATLAMNGGNNAEGNGLMNSGSATVENTLFYNPSAPLECSGAPPTFNGVNMIPDGSCGCTAPACLDGSWALPALADNGGATPTHALESGHPAIDSAGDTVCLAEDQRAVERPQGDGCDVGAYESEFIADPQLGVVPATIDFGNVMVGQDSPAQSATISNDGNVELTGLGVGAASGDFELVSSNCDTELSPGDQCAVVVRFQPQSEQTYTESVTVSTNETGTTSLMLQGIGIPFVDAIFGDRFNADN